MNKIGSYTDYSNIIKILSNAYRLDFEDAFLHRDVVGYVYFLRKGSRRYVLKIYRSFNTEDALQSIEVMNYLKMNDYPVASIIAAGDESLYIKFMLPEGACIGVLFDFIVGTEPNIENEIVSIGQQIGQLHNLMEKYPSPLISRGKAYFIDQFISILHELRYNPVKAKELEVYGNYLWRNMELLPKGFCHGDLHSGNILKNKLNQYVLFDFDIVSQSHSIIDVATLVDNTNFFKLEEAAYEGTKRTLEKFYLGYIKERSISEIEMVTLFDFIAIRHYELIATLSNIQGIACLSHKYLDEQYEWLMQWRNLCSQKGAIT